MSTEDNVCKSVLATVLSASQHIGFKAGTSGLLLLNPQKQIPWNDGIIIVLYIILRNKSLILYSFFGKKVSAYRLLQEGITDVLFVSENLTQCCCTLFGFARCRLNTVSLQSPADDVVAVTFQIFPKDSFHHFSFFLVDDELSVFILVISKKTCGADLYLPLLVNLSMYPMPTFSAMCWNHPAKDSVPCPIFPAAQRCSKQIRQY